MPVKESVELREYVKVLRKQSFTKHDDESHETHGVGVKMREVFKHRWIPLTTCDMIQRL